MTRDYDTEEEFNFLWSHLAAAVDGIFDSHCHRDELSLDSLVPSPPPSSVLAALVAAAHRQPPPVADRRQKAREDWQKFTQHLKRKFVLQAQAAAAPAKQPPVLAHRRQTLHSSHRRSSSLFPAPPSRLYPVSAASTGAYQPAPSLFHSQASARRSPGTAPPGFHRRRLPPPPLPPTDSSRHRCRLPQPAASPPSAASSIAADGQQQLPPLPPTNSSRHHCRLPQPAASSGSGRPPPPPAMSVANPPPPPAFSRSFPATTQSGPCFHSRDEEFDSRRFEFDDVPFSALQPPAVTIPTDLPSSSAISEAEKTLYLGNEESKKPAALTFNSLLKLMGDKSGNVEKPPTFTPTFFSGC